MRLFTILLALCQKVGAIDDYVTEQGVSGIWEYKKWHSGTKECYARAYMSYENGTSWLGGYYHQTETIAFPAGLFSNNPRVVSTEADAVLTIVCGTVSSRQNTSFYILNGASGTGNITLNIHAKGT